VKRGNSGACSMIELAEKAKALTGLRSELIHNRLLMNDPKHRQPDIELAREQLGWEPTVKLEEGLKPMIAYFEQLLLVATRNEGYYHLKNGAWNNNEYN
jgi:UDP-glucuronate decarboxylase